MVVTCSCYIIVSSCFYCESVMYILTDIIITFVNLGFPLLPNVYSTLVHSIPLIKGCRPIFRFRIFRIFRIFYTPSVFFMLSGFSVFFWISIYEPCIRYMYVQDTSLVNVRSNVYFWLNNNNDVMFHLNLKRT